MEVSYEGQPRRFSIDFISVRPPGTGDPVGSLTEEVELLSFHSQPLLWTTGWDTSVCILENEMHHQVDYPHKVGCHGTLRTWKPEYDACMCVPFQPDIETLEQTTPSDAYATVGGLNKTIAEIRDLIEIPLTRPELFAHFGGSYLGDTHDPSYLLCDYLGLKPPRGILLHGPPGTGKTHLARAIAASTRSSVIIINGPELSSAYHGETEARLREVFRNARAKSPCIVVLDEIDALVPRREDGAGGEVEKRVVATLLTIMDGMEDEIDRGTIERVVVIGTTNRPNSIDPALRRPGRFDREFEIGTHWTNSQHHVDADFDIHYFCFRAILGVPDAEARLAILEVLLTKTPHSISQADLRVLAGRAHGYVGADLSAVVREAGTLAIKRWVNALGSNVTSLNLLTIADLSDALPSVRPSAMRSVFLDTPPVRYSDVGGQAAAIQKLREAVEWPLLHPEAFERLGVRPPKGLLLYGPPGCSKTVLARACATESGVNFVAVKGPEAGDENLSRTRRLTSSPAPKQVCR